MYKKNPYKNGFLEEGATNNILDLLKWLYEEKINRKNLTTLFAYNNQDYEKP